MARSYVGHIKGICVRNKIEVIVLLCMMFALYLNLTDMPKQQPPTEVRGILEKFQQ
jgi:hypothetical protein